MKSSKKAIFILLLGIGMCWSLAVMSNPADSVTNKKNTTEIKDAVKDKDTVLNDKYLADWLLYLSLGLSVVSILLAVISLRRHTLHEDDVDRMIIRYVKTPDLVQNTNSTSQSVTRHDIEKVIEQAFNDRQMNVIVDRVRECLRLDEEEQKHGKLPVTSTQESAVKSQNAISILYASQADASTNTFFEVKSQPDDTTIYELKVDKGLADFKVFAGAKEKVLGSPRNLECAGEMISSVGSQNVITLEHGTTEKLPDGKWKIIKKAKIKFE